MTEWQPIETAPKDETPFLGWVSDDWIEGFYYSEGELCYTSDGDGPTAAYQMPKFWRPWPEPPG